MRSTAVILFSLAWTVSAQQRPADGLNFFSLDREIAMGQQTAGVLAPARIEDPALNAYVAKLGAAVAQSADQRFPYTFVFYDDRKPLGNPVPAWAVPADAGFAHSEPIAIAGGPIFVPLSLLANSTSESAFAFQLAHAVAHVALRHATKAFTREGLVQIGMIPLQSSGKTWAEAAQLGVPLGLLQFARAAERQADFLAVSLVDAAGYNPLDAVPYLETLPESRPQALSAHPLGSSRAAAVRDAAGKLPTRTYEADTGQFQAMKAQAKNLK
jgi:predicted Zn-dependent protease